MKKKNDAFAAMSKTDALKSLVTLMFITLFVCLGMYQLQPPKAVPADAPTTEFSAERAMKHIEAIAQHPHPPGSLEHTRVREYILSEFTTLGIATEVQKTSGLHLSYPRNLATVNTANAQNIIARLQGTDSAKAILIAGHYDSVVSSPNASDGGSSVAVALELARVLQAGPPLKNDVIFILTDAEEHTPLGAQGFVEQHPWVKDVGLVLHFIARGTSGPSIMFETSSGNEWLIEQFAKSAPHPIANSLTYEVYQLLPNYTDFIQYRRAGLPGFNFGYIDNPAHYHTMLDNPENLDERSLQHHGAYALALTHHFGNLDLAHSSKGNAVYFDVWGLTMIQYPETWVIPLMLVVILVYAGVIITGLKRERLTFSGIGIGVLFLLLNIFSVSVAITLIGQVVLALHREYQSIFLGNIYNSRIYLVGFVSFAIAITSTLYVVFRKRAQFQNLTAGGLSVWLILALATAFFIPGASYLFTWPLLFSLLALGATFIPRAQETVSVSWRHIAVFLLGSIPGLVLLVPVTVLMSTTLPPLGMMGSWMATGGLVVGILVALLLGSLAPLITIIIKPKAWLLPAVAIVLGVLSLVTGSLTASFNAEHPKPNTILYGFNVDTGKAAWLSRDAQLDEWTSQFFPEGTERTDAGDWSYLRLDTRYFIGPAPVTSVPIPEIELLDDNVNDGVRSLRLNITLPQPARSLVALVKVEPGALLSVRLNDAEIQTRTEDSEMSIQQWGYSPFSEVGFELFLETPASQPVEVVVFGGFDGLPQAANLSFSPRPADMMPAPMPVASEGQEMILVRKSFEFPAHQE